MSHPINPPPREAVVRVLLIFLIAALLPAWQARAVSLTWAGNRYATLIWGPSTDGTDNWYANDNFTTWQSGATAVFAADGIGAITVYGTQYVGGVLVEEPGYSFSGGDISLASGTTAFVMTPTSGEPPTVISSVISGSNNFNVLSVVGTGILELTGTNTYSGGTYVGGMSGSYTGGLLEVSSGSSLGYGALTLNGGELITNGNFAWAGATTLLTVDGSNTLAAAAGTVGTFTGPISGSGTLNIGDSLGNTGTVFLADGNANPYSFPALAINNGATLEATSLPTSASITINGGTLRTNDFSTSDTISLGSGTNTLGTVGSGYPSTFNGQISGGALTVTGNTVVLGNALNNYTGGTTISNGTLEVSADGDLGSGNLTMTNGEFLTSANFSTSKSITLTAGGNNHDVLAATPGTTATYNSAIGGTAALYIGDYNGDGANTGTVVLTSVGNNYTGGTYIETGATLQVATEYDLPGFNNPMGATTLYISGGTFDTTGSFSTNYAITLAPDVPNADTLAVSGNGNTATYNGVIQGGALTVTGYTVALTNTGNTYEDGTTISYGALEVAADADLGGSGNLTLGGESELLTTGSNNSFSTSRQITLNNGYFSAILAAAPGTTATYAGAIGGSGGLTVGDGVNTGTVALTASNSYSGGTVIETGATLAINNDDELGGIGNSYFVGNTTVNVLLQGGILDIQQSMSSSRTIGLYAGSTNTISVAGSQTFRLGGLVTDGGSGGALTVGGGGTLVLTNTGNNYSGGTTINIGIVHAASDGDLGTGGITLGSDSELVTNGAFSTTKQVTLSTNFGLVILAAAPLTSATYAGAIGGGFCTLNVGDSSNTGTVMLTASNTFAGKVSINSGTLSVPEVSTGSTPQPLGEGNTVTLGVADTSSGTLEYTGSGGTLDKNITSLGNGSDTVQNAGAGLLTLSGTLTKDQTHLTLSGKIDVTGPIEGPDPNSDLIITGGVVTLSNSDSYNGATIVNGGTLLLGNAEAIPAGSPVTLDGGTLALTGSDMATGMLGALTILGNSAIDLSGADNAIVFANSNSSSWSGSLSIYNWNSSDSLSFGTDATGLGSGQAESIAFYSDTGSNMVGTAQISSNGSVTVSPVPEPADWALLLAGSGAIAGAQIRRSRAARRLRSS